MRVIIPRTLLPLIVQGATPAEIAELARELALTAEHFIADRAQSGRKSGADQAQAACSAPARPLKAVCYAPVFGLTPEGVAAVRTRRTRQPRGGGRVTVGRVDGQPELPMDLPGTPERLLGSVDQTGAGAPVSQVKTTGHGGQASHPPAPESLVQLMRLLVSRYKVEELAQKIPLDEAQVIRMYKGKRGTSPKTLRRLLDIASTSKPFLHVHTDLQNQLWADIKVRAHHLPKSWK